MNAANAALWYIESHFREDVSLDEVASVAGVSRYHLSRLFSSVMGCSISQYVRGRRLTEAAKVLANGAPDILTVALDVGYGSHEAFTRAFREQFGVTPESVRARRDLENLQLVEAILMNQEEWAKLETPRFLNRDTFLVAGLGDHYIGDSSAGIPELWQRFEPLLGNIPGQIGETAYGVVYNTDEAGSMDYIAGVEVADFSRLTTELKSVRIPAQRYVVFTHRDHVSTIRRTWHTIWAKWIPESGHQVVDAPVFERYPKEFDGRTGLGGLELWVPVK